MDPVLQVSIVGEDEPERLEAAAHTLREELLELDVGDVRRLTAGPAPDGARGIDLAALGGLIVSLPAVPELFAAVVDGSAAGLPGRRRGRSGSRSTATCSSSARSPTKTRRGWSTPGCNGGRPVARKALVVANDRYTDPGLQQLRAPGHDAAALSEVLGDPDIGRFDVGVVSNADVQHLRERLDTFFGTAGREDDLLLHLSCHGLKDDSNDLYLAASDTRPALLASTGLPADFLARRMRASRARTVTLLLDCCYGGAFERGMLARAGTDVPVLDAFGADHPAEGAGRVVITASSAVEYAFESGDLADPGAPVPSVFTGAVVAGILTGEADMDGTGTISIQELFTYAERHVRRTNPRQTPHMWSFGTRGAIMIARSPVRRVVPAALPVSVQTALAGDRISRLGAVHVLAEMLGDDDPSKVLAAVEALEYLAGDDSKSLSEAAAHALNGIRLTASPAAVTLGPEQPSAEVTLGGSILAVAARVRSAPDQVHVRQIRERLRITAGAPGVTGTITVAGPTGAIEIPVTVGADVPAPPARVVAAPPAEPVPAAPPTEPAPARRAWDGVQQLWIAAAICLAAVPFLPIDPDGARIIDADQIGSGESTFWLLELLIHAALFAFAAWLYQPRPTAALVLGTVAALLSSGFSIVGLASTSGLPFGIFVALAGTAAAIAGTVLAFRRR